MSLTAAPPELAPDDEESRVPARLRRFSRRAEISTLRSKARIAKRDGDQEGEKQANTALARALASRGILLDQATKAARRALLLGDDSSLREDLSAWFAGLGEMSLACAALRPLLQQQSGEAAMQTLIRIAVLSARAGDDVGAVDALSGAAKEAPANPLPLELLAATRFWSESALSADDAGLAYLQAAGRHRALGQASAAFEDLLRAFEVAPGLEQIASALAAELSARNRKEAAEEVWRHHASQSQNAKAVHWARLERALSSSDLAAALQAAFDADLLVMNAEVAHSLASPIGSDGNQQASRVQELLWQCGLGLLALARLSEAARHPELSGPERAELLVRAGTAWLARFSNEDEATRAFSESLALDPGREDAQAELERLHETRARRLASWSDPPPKGPTGSVAEAWLVAKARGDLSGQAQALQALARLQTPKIRSVLLGAAAEALVELGHLEAALRVTHEAVLADPDSARAVCTQAEIAVALEQGHVEAVERAVRLVLPRASWCRVLVKRYWQSDPSLSLAWAERYLVLRPGSLDAARLLLQASAQAAHAGKLAGGLEWALSQPEPLSSLADVVAESLEDLALLSPERAEAVARRAMGVLGPRDPEVRRALLSLASTLEKPALAALLLERWLVVAEVMDPAAFLELSELHYSTGDSLGFVTALTRALTAGANARLVLERLEQAGEPEDPDALLHYLELLAEALEATGADSEQSVLARRTYASASWDMAGDVELALSNLARAVDDAAEHPSWLFEDLRELAGGDWPERLIELVEDPRLSRRSALLLAEGAARAAAEKLYSAAETLGIRAISLDASLTEALTHIEEASRQSGGTQTIERAYDLLASGVMGRFGERALHYRAAHFFESTHRLDQALGHAIRAFEAVPVVGVALSMMQTLASQTGNRTPVVESLERVARAARDDKARVEWWLLAADATDTNSAGYVTRVRLLFRALVEGPERGVFMRCHEALTQLGVISPEKREALGPEFAELVRSVLPKLEGPAGARAAIEAARMAVAHFGNAELGIEALLRAMAQDADIDEYARLLEYAEFLVKAGPPVEALLARAEELANNRFRLVGASLIELARKLAVLGGDDRRVERLTTAKDAVALASDGSKDEEPKLEAPAPSGEADDASIATELGRWVEQGSRAEAERDFVTAKAHLLKALSLAKSSQERDLALANLLRVEQALGDTEGLSNLWADREAFAPTLLVDLAIALAQTLAQVPGQEQRALAFLKEQKQTLGSASSYLRRWFDLAKRLDDPVAQREPLESMLDLVEGPEKLDILRQLARLLEKQHLNEEASRYWQMVHDADPQDLEALRALERQAEAAGNYEQLVKLLRKRVEDTGDVAGRSGVRLRRAKLLIQKLGRTEEAVSELMAAANSGPVDAQGLAAVAQLVPVEEAARTARLWLVLAEKSENPEQCREWVRRARLGFVASRETDLARSALLALARVCSPEVVAQERVELERAIGQKEELAKALAGLAEVSSEPHQRRASYLVEATRLVARLNELGQALAYAERACEIDGDNPDVHVCLEWLGYLAGGPSASGLSTRAVSDLRKWDVGLSRDLSPLRSFLLAEALDLNEGGGAGLRELRIAAADLGEQGVVALGLAERLAILEDYDRALGAFDHALSGDLMLVRSRGEVLMRAAQVARGARRFDRAKHYLQEAESEPDVRELALELSARVNRELEAEARRPPPEVSPLLGTANGDPQPPALSTEGSKAPYGHATQPRGNYSIQPAAYSEETIVLKPKHSPDGDRARTRGTQGKSDAPADGSPPSADTSLASVKIGRYSLRAEAVPSEEVRLETARSGSAAGAVRSKSTALPGLQPESPTGAGIVEPQASLEATDEAGPLDAREMNPEASLESSKEDSRKVKVPGAYSVIPSEASPELISPRRSSSQPPRAVDPEPEPSPESPRAARGSLEPQRAPERLPSLAPASQSPRRSSSGRIRAMTVWAPESIAARSSKERELLAELALGSLPAGRELVLLLEGERQREQDRVLLCQHLCQSMPGDTWVLTKLLAAAEADRNPQLSRAVQHVLSVAQVASPVEPPPLENQSEQSEAVQALLFKEAGSAASEALALAWEGAQHVFLRDAKAYDIASYERIAVGSLNRVGKAFTAVARSLGLTRVPFHHRSGAQPFDARVALVAPPAILAVGAVDVGSNELLFQLGAAITAALPQYALLFGLPEQEARSILLALVSAFGPPGQSHEQLAASAQMAEVLWEGIPRRSQRRLQELCHEVEEFSYEAAMRVARLGQYRAGLFACGNLNIAVQQICALESRSMGDLSEPGALARLCEESSAVADAVRLACNPLYAEMRWRRVETSTSRLLI